MDHLIAFFKTFENKDIATLIVATYGAVFSTLNFGWPRIKEWKESRKALFRALQGEKEAISDVATQVIDGKLDAKLKRKRDFRIRLIKALSMAFVLESSDRAKAYVVAAFEHICRIDRTSKAELVSQLEAIERIFTSYDGLVNDNDFRVKRLAKLQVVLAHIRKYGAPAA
jgi:hypothetical protein